MTEPSEKNAWTRLTEAALPLPLTYGLVFLGLWFILIPAGVALDIWGFYAVGIVGAVVVGLLTRRCYRQVVLERAAGYCVLRIDYLPWRNRGRTRSEATGEPE